MNLRGGGVTAGGVESSTKGGRVEQSSGFALVLVMIIIVVLGMLAGSFALSMKVETRLAATSSNDSELEWLGRSGVEMARYILAEGMKVPYTSLNQVWAGGPGSGPETNTLAGISLLNNPLGSGSFSLRIVDLDRKFNVNSADQEVLNRALTIVGVDAGDFPVIVDSILDWRDPDPDPHLSGTESDVYMTYTPPYLCKDGPIDDLAELLLVRGVTPEIYWGPRATNHAAQFVDAGAGNRRHGSELSAYPVGLVDLLSPLSGRQINVNTASLYALQMLPGVDEQRARNIITARAGPDGMEGTEDDVPFRNLSMLPGLVPGITPQMVAQLARFAGVTSMGFEITVDARIGQTHRRFAAIVRRVSPREIPILQFSWK